MFFINEGRAANQLKQLGQIQSRDGPLSIFVKQCPPPKGSAHGDKYNPKIESASWAGVRSGAGNSDYDDIMEEDPTEVVKVTSMSSMHIYIPAECVLLWIGVLRDVLFIMFSEHDMYFLWLISMLEFLMKQH